MSMFDYGKKLVEKASKTERCVTCKAECYVALDLLAPCDICCRRFCKKNCLTKRQVPFDLLPMQLRTQMTESVSNQQHSVCGECLQTVIRFEMKLYKERLLEKVEEFFLAFLANDQFDETRVLYPKPTKVEDSNYRKALRYSKIAELAADVTGYSTVMKAAKALYYSKEIMASLIAGDLMKSMGPLMEALQVFDISGPTGLLNVYYLGCKHVLDVKSNPDVELNQHFQNSTGVLMDSCPVYLLDLVGNYLSMAQMLYSAELPVPHDSSDWKSWYLTRLAAGQEWTVLASMTESLKLADSSKCPAFALFARRRRVTNIGSRPYLPHDTLIPDELKSYFDSTSRWDDNCKDATWEQEAVLCIRGTSEAIDWSINLDESPKDFSFCLSALTEGSNFDFDKCSVQGFVHRGIYQGATAILDSCNMRRFLSDLSLNGYKVTIVGHSLGAGTAALLAAELQNGYRLGPNKILHNSVVRAVCIATPPCMSLELAQAVTYDGLVLNVINWGDAIPRVSRNNIIKLAQEVKDISDVTKEWRTIDMNAIQAHLANIGKAAEMTSLDEELSPSQPLPSAPMVPNAETSVPTVVIAQSIRSSPTEVPANAVVGVVVPSNSSVSSTEKSSSSSSFLKSSSQTFQFLSSAASMISSSNSILPSLSSTNNSSNTTPPVVIDFRLNIPGAIIQLYKHNGHIRSAVIDVNHESLHRLRLLHNQSIQDHEMQSYWNNLRSLRLDSVLRTKSLTFKPHVKWESLCKGDEKFKICKICLSDPNWAYILQSAANRAYVSHHCNLCGQIVCVLCAPTGEEIPGDGLNTYTKLADKRITMPTLGLFDRKRVCMHCYLESYNLIRKEEDSMILSAV